MQQMTQQPVAYQTLTPQQADLDDRENSWTLAFGRLLGRVLRRFRSDPETPPSICRRHQP